MPTTDEDRVHEVLDEAECRRLLGTTRAGRIGFTDGALPAILPVPFAVHDGQVMIPARRDSPVVRAVHGAVVAFGVDSYDAVTDTGWSVTLVGPARLVWEPPEPDVVAGWRLPARPAPPHRCFIAVAGGLLRGWRLSAGPVVASVVGQREAADARFR